MIQWEIVEPETHYLTNDSRSATDRIEPVRNSESRLRASGKREFEFVPLHQVFALPVFNCFLLLQQRSSFTLFSWGGRKGLRWCGFALFFVRFCGNFYFNSRYCGFKTLSGLRLLQPLSRGFRWEKVSAVITLFRTVGIRLSCKREPSVLFTTHQGSLYQLTI